MRRGGRRGIRGSSRREVDGIEPSFLFSSRRARIRNKSIVARHLSLSLCDYKMYVNDPGKRAPSLLSLSLRVFNNRTTTTKIKTTVSFQCY